MKPISTVRDNVAEKRFDVRSGIRTHAHRSGLRPERSALDHSAILTFLLIEVRTRIRFEICRALMTMYVPPDAQHEENADQRGPD